MAQLNTLSMKALVNNTISTVQGLTTQLVDVSVGSICLALIQAVSGIAMWLQGLILTVLGLTRFATSYGADADSFGAQFSFPRLPAQPATGSATFFRSTPTNPATIQAATKTGTDQYDRPIYSGGQIIETADGTQLYQVIPDTTQTAYNATSNLYTIAAGVNSAVATVQAVTAGSASNALPGVVNTLATNVPYVDSVSNATALTNGADAESDTAYKARFPVYLASLEDGTPTAIINATESVQQGVSADLVENQTIAGIPQPGFFYEVIDDGTGNPNATLINAVAAAVDAARPITTTFAIYGPSILTANVSMIITVSAGYLYATVIAEVQSALTEYINSLPIGQTLPYSILSKLAFDASPGITNVTNIRLNGAQNDLVPASSQVIKVGQLTVSSATIGGN